MVRIARMTSHGAILDRRSLIGGLGAFGLGAGLAPTSLAQGHQTFAIFATAQSLVLRAGTAATPIWSLSGADIRAKRGETIEITFSNDLPVLSVLCWRGLDGAPAAEPLLRRAPLAPAARQTFQLSLPLAGTFVCDPGLLGDGQARPSRAGSLIVLETENVEVDRDEILLIEEWRLRPDGTAIAPGTDFKDTVAVYTVNGRTSFEISARPNERLRLRFINASQRTVLALKLENHELRVMAIDGEPAEPFPARNGALVLAPGGRADALVDVVACASILLHDGKEARSLGTLQVSGEALRAAPLPAAPPLPSNGLPRLVDLKNAARFEVTLGAAADWARPADFTAVVPPAFRAKTGRTVVLALTNRAPGTTVFHLHGHHFRLLDRLDDGWKPFWLDTIAIEPGQTERIAFAAEHVGRFLIEQVGTDWAAPRLVRWYSVE
jgi:FtsP/CotA-like multicopper oxidase with cupredoxin domain